MSNDFLRQFRKLRKMSPGEIRGRVQDKLRTRRDRRSFLRRSHRHACGLMHPAASELLTRAERLVLGVSATEIEQLQKASPLVFEQFARAARRRAAHVQSGCYEMLGHAFDLRGPIDWHADPRSAARFDRVFHTDVSLHRNGGAGIDVKYIWELGRQQYLVELARNWLFHRNDADAARVRDVILDWIQANPLFEGVHWTSGLEVAMRSISWIWALASLSDWCGWKLSDLSTIAASFEDHARYLQSHFSFYSSPYNHIIGEATGLLLVSRLLNGFDEAADWDAQARQVLTRHAPRQFHGDGFCVEQAIGYHYYTLGFLTLAIVAARRSGRALDDVESAAHQAFVAGELFRMPNGQWPAIGDVDSARSIPVEPDEFWNFDGLCSVGAVLFRDSRLKPQGAEAGEELYWLLGSDGLAEWKKMAASSPEACRTLAGSGYFLGRRGGDWLCVDAGPISDGLHSDSTPSTAHGHLDALQVLYCHDGQPALIDPGMPFYFGDREWVSHFRGAAAHNTIELEGLPVARDAGGLQWSQVLDSFDLQAGESDQVWTATTRLRLDGEGQVERVIVCIPRIGLWIADAISLRSPRKIRWHWQLGVPMDLSAHPENGVFARGVNLVLAGWCDPRPTSVLMTSSQITSPSGWQAPGYGILRMGSQIEESLSDVRQALKVTFVGPAPGSFSISWNGTVIESMEGSEPLQRIECGQVTWMLPESASIPVVAESGSHFSRGRHFNELRSV